MMTGARGAGGGGDSVHSVPLRGPRFAGLLLAAFAAVLLLVRLGRADLFNPDEPREAELAREMLVSGDLVVPQLNGAPFLEKPPLFYWLAVPAFRLAGGPGEATARLVPALCGLATVLLTFWFARVLFGDAVALLAGLVLTTAFEFFWIARRAMIDMPLTLAVLLACVALHRASARDARARPGWLALAAAACAAALLLKGIVGAGLPALALVAWLVARRDLRRLVRPGLLLAGSLALVPIALWVGQLYGRLGPAGVREFVLVNNVMRFTGGASRGHDNPLWYYLPTLFADFAPWSIVLPFALVAAVRAPGARREAARDLALWFAVPLLVLSIASTKRGLYLLPIYPPAAMLVAWWLVGGDTGPGQPQRGARRAAFWILSGLMAALSIASLWAWHLVRPSAVAGPLAAAIALSVAAVAAWRAVRGADGRRLGLAVAGGAAILELLTACALVPAIVNRGASARPIGEAIRGHLETGDHVALYGIKEGSMGGLLYYAGHTLPVLRGSDELERYLDDAGAPGGSRLLVLMRAPAFEETARVLPFPLVEARRWRPAAVPWETAGANDFVLAARGP
jgi:4-amino-4-deoxy-L-arabinose transferase-like glycosyltransferase